MTFRLHVDAARWRAHQTAVIQAVGSSLAGPPHRLTGDSADDASRGAETCALVPVVKGNGYGFGRDVLFAQARALGATVVAVGTVFEARSALEPGADGLDLLVLTPYDPRDAAAAVVWHEILAQDARSRVIITVASVEGWQALCRLGTPVRVVLEAATSMGRFGLTEQAIESIMGGLSAKVPAADSADVASSPRAEILGLALHLPLAQPRSGGPRPDAATDRVGPDRGGPAVVLRAGAGRRAAAGSGKVREAAAWGRFWEQQVTSAPAASDGSAPRAAHAACLWVSHLDDHELSELAVLLPRLRLRPRIGTRLWLGDRGAVTARGTVLAVHPLVAGSSPARGWGYWQRLVSGGCSVLVVGGGTAHGVALQAPSAATTLRQRAVAAGAGVLAALGRALSPFVVGGRQLWFVEPPHMHVSLVRLPRGVNAPAVGAEIEVQVRMTVASFDEVTGL